MKTKNVNQILISKYIIKTLQEIHYFHFPLIISHLIFKFFYIKFDYWNPQRTHQSIQIHDSKLLRTTMLGTKSAFMTNIVSTGIHIWKIEVIQPGYNDLIGIESINSLQLTNFNFYYKQANRCVYFSKFTRFKTITNNIFLASKDILEMKVDFINLQLSFSKNNLLLQVQQITKDQYRAAVCLSEANVSFNLLEYKSFCYKLSH